MKLEVFVFHHCELRRNVSMTTSMLVKTTRGNQQFTSVFCLVGMEFVVTVWAFGGTCVLCDSSCFPDHVWLTSGRGRVTAFDGSVLECLVCDALVL